MESRTAQRAGGGARGRAGGHLGPGASPRPARPRHPGQGEHSHLVTLHCDYLYGEQVAGPDTPVTDLQFSPAGDLVLVSTEAGEMEALYKP